MDNIYYEKTLYRILQGRLRFKRGDLVLFVYEPSLDLLEESLDIYDEAYKQAYYNNVPIKKDLIETLVENNIWTPLDDKEAEKLDKDIEDLKVQAFEKFYDKRLLNTIKMNIQILQAKATKVKYKKMTLDHTSCEGVASYARQIWILDKTTFYTNGSLYDWADITKQNMFDYYMENYIKYEDLRYVARNDPWRMMWNTAKKHGNLFDRKTKDLTRDQNMLAHYSSMYDNIYEHPDAPSDKVIEDDDALDGWLIKQKRDREKQKKQQEVDALTKNPKIANSQEVFVMARDTEAAKEIYDLNNPLARKTIQDRNAQIQNSDGSINFKELNDVKQDIAIQSHQQALQGTKGRGRGRR